MLSIALRTLRLRWVSFAGTFVALALGVGLITAMGLVLAASVAAPPRPPQRYATAPAVVAAPDTLTVTTGYGTHTERLTEPPGLPAELVASVAATGPVILDRTFYAQLAGVAAAGEPVGHAWSAASATGYALTAGSAPTRDTEVVLSGDARIGEQVTVWTIAGSGSYTVSGTVDERPYETAVFFTDAVAAQLSPRVDAVIAYGPLDDVRAAVGDRGRVLSGADRALLDRGRDGDADRLNDTNSLVGVAGGFAAFVAIFVVAATFGYSVAQRRREIGLLRTIGATPAQVRRMLFGEAALLGVVASALGCVLGGPVASPVLDWLIRLNMAPEYLPDSTSPVPQVVAFSTGLLVALAGVWVASWRAGRVRPAEAMREAVVDSRAMTLGRWTVAVGTLGTALVMMAMAVLDPQSATNDKSYLPTVMVLVVAFALLTPIAVAPVARLLTAPLRRLPAATGMLVRASTLTSVRRTAAIAAPVLVAVGLAAALGGAAGTIDVAQNKEDQRRVLADFVVRPVDAPGFGRTFVERLSQVDGIDVAAPVPTSVYNVHQGIQLVARPVQAVQPAGLPRVLNLPLVAGSLADLDDDSIVVSTYWSKQVGDLADVWLADGSRATLRVAAVMADGPSADAYVTPRYGTALAPLIYVKLRPGADPGTVQAAMHAATTDAGAAVVTRADWFARAADRQGEASRLGLLIVLGIVLSYTAIAIINTMLMAAAERGQEIATLRLTGATPGQVVRIFAMESLVAVTIGVVLAVGAAGVGLLGLWTALLRLVGLTPIMVPWQLVGLVAAGSAVLTVAATVASVARQLRRPAVERAGAPE